MRGVLLCDRTIRLLRSVLADIIGEFPATAQVRKQNEHTAHFLRRAVI